MSDVVVGRVFNGRWRVERPLMTGGMGSVFVAAHTDTGRKVALKVVKSEAANNAELVARFQRETGALAAVSHPNVVTFLDSGIEDGTFFLVMELLEGRPLRTALADAPFAWRRAFRIAADVCRALAAVHQAGLVHRDLKPENIFLQSAVGIDEIAKLIDFGIVRLQEGLSAAPTAATTTGAVVGTPGYISPEQLKGEAASPQSDVYAVGVILYEMVTGKFPFAAPTPHAMLVRQLMEPLAPPRAQLATVPAHVEAVIVKLLERDPAARPASALAALQLLQDALGADDSLAPSAPTEDGVAVGMLAAQVVAASASTAASTASIASTNASSTSPPSPAASTNANSIALPQPTPLTSTSAPVPPRSAVSVAEARALIREERRQRRAQRSPLDRALRAIGIAAAVSMLGVVGTCGMCARACSEHHEEKREVERELKRDVEKELKKDIDVAVKPSSATPGKGDIDIKIGAASLHLTDVDMPDGGPSEPKLETQDARAPRPDANEPKPEPPKETPARKLRHRVAR